MEIKPEHVGKKHGKNHECDVDNENQPAGHVMSRKDHGCLYYRSKLILFGNIICLHEFAFYTFVALTIYRILFP
jgi:hypothetical protein